jgi:dTMP kinase
MAMLSIMTTELGPVPGEETTSDVKAISTRGAGKFYVFEGIDGSGKTTVSRRLFEKISQESHREVLLTTEPTDSWLGDAVRRSYDEDVNPLTEALLFVADRANHTERITDWLSKGIIVLCDRYNASTLAYQGAALQKRMGNSAIEWLKSVSSRVIIEPDITFLFSVSPEKAILRLNRRDEISKFERVEYLMEVDAIYRKVADEDPTFFVVDASAPLEDVIDEVLRAIKADL